MARGSRLVFEWDAAKSDRCLRERGFGFDYVTLAFNDPHHRVEPDRRRDYGEDRFTLFGRVEERLYVVAYTVRGRIIRIISAHKANSREQLRYGQGPSPS